MKNENDLRYPIGKFSLPELISKPIITDWINEIAAFPEKIKTATKSLSEIQLDTPYRPGGWTVRQVVHHCADSHMNSFMRFKLALTEEKPIIKPYYEDRWATTADGKRLAIDASLLILEGLHKRWVSLLWSLSEDDLSKSFVHPEHGKEISLFEGIGLYAWHGAHHLAHITGLKERKGWL